MNQFSRSKIRLQRERLDLNELVGRAAEDRRTALEQRGVRFQVALAPQALFAKVDGKRVVQILDNLLENARKFTDQGDTVSVRVASEPTSG